MSDDPQIQNFWNGASTAVLVAAAWSSTGLLFILEPETAVSATLLAIGLWLICYLLARSLMRAKFLAQQRSGPGSGRPDRQS